VSSDEDKSQSASEQDLLKELASILNESGGGEVRKPAAPTGPMSTANVDQDLIRELSDLLTETGLTEIEVDQNGMRVRVARTAGGPSVGVAPIPAAALAPQPSDAGAAPEQHAGAVTSPMVGTAYLSPEPGAAAFVQDGDTVREGQTLMIVEAMKTMNPIPAPKAGKVTKILVNDGQPVEFGEPLMIVE